MFCQQSFAPNVGNDGGILDKVTCYKYIAAKEGTSICYRSKTEEAKRCNAAARRLQRKCKTLQDKDNEFGPPDKSCHIEKERRNDKATVTVDENTLTVYPNNHPEVIGKRVKVKYDEEEGSQW